MESTRQQKYSKLIQKDLSEIFQKNKSGLFTNVLVTIAEVKITPDLSIAKVYLSMLLVEDKQAMIEKITEHKSEIRRDLGNKIGKQVRIVPDLLFYLDDIEQEASRMDKLIDSLDIPPLDEEE